MGQSKKAIVVKKGLPPPGFHLIATVVPTFVDNFYGIKWG